MLFAAADATAHSTRQQQHSSQLRSTALSSSQTPLGLVSSCEQIRRAVKNRPGIYVCDLMMVFLCAELAPLFCTAVYQQNMLGDRGLTP